MDLKTAITTYQFAERAKSELIVGSQLTTALIVPLQEKPGGKRMLLMVLESIRSEIMFAYGNTELTEFKKAVNHLNEAISLVESMDLGSAAERLSKAISAVTTAAQAAWETLQEHDLV